MLRCLAALLLWFIPAYADRCSSCHPREAQGYAGTAMARSLAIAALEPPGSFEHSISHTTFTIRNTAAGVIQELRRAGEAESLPVQYSVGSGTHAFGYLAQIGNHLFQSPVSYYTSKRQWDIAPGYEQAAAPDFTRPVTAECLACHSGQARPLSNTLNTYENPSFTETGITCERCHGSTEAHLKNPVPGTVLNPAKLPEPARDSICEQCHLAGDVRIPNPGKRIIDFHPGQTLEEIYTVYVTAHGPDQTVKVISQAEQLALSTCKRRAGAKMWCATCHDPHQQPARPAEYFRGRCLTCHRETLAAQHAALDDCIGCHMPRRPARDGGHTAFTDHRIARHPNAIENTIFTPDLAAWREPPAQLRDRNLALALVAQGIQDGNSTQVIRGYRTLNRLPPAQQNDPDVLASLGTVLLTAKESGEAAKSFQHALALRPDYAPYEVNLATALFAQNQRSEAIHHLEHTLTLDPLLQKAVSLLAAAYRAQGEPDKASQLMAKYRCAMGFSSPDCH